MKWDEAKSRGLGERDAAIDAGAARSTVRRWEARRNVHDDHSFATIQFFESPEGLECLSRIVVAVQFVIGLLSPGGIRLVSTFFRLSGLDAFVGASVGVTQKTATDLVELVLQFAEEQRAALASRMSPKTITVCEDETFHPEICLVAIEPVSNFILVEEYAENRKAETWSTVMGRAVADLPVTVIQATSDEAKALKAHAEDSLHAHHSPDLFHVQREASRATSLPLMRRVEQAEQALETAMTATEQAILDQTAYEAIKDERGPGRPPSLAGRIDAARAAEEDPCQSLDRAVDDRDQARAAIAGISTVYHPYALNDGTVQTPAAVAAQLEAKFNELESISQRADLSEKAAKGIAKAKRVTPAMVDTIRFVHQQTTARLAALSVSLAMRQDLAERFVPGKYLEAIARKAPTAEERRKLTATAQSLLQPLYAPEHRLQKIPVQQRARLEAIADECAQLFQRSSSCVEGRNGHLALHHHSLHRLPARKLAALTVVHNYFTRRSDGTTAAERFFGSPHEDLFENLVARMPPPPRPRSATPTRRTSAPVVLAEAS